MDRFFWKDGNSSGGAGEIPGIMVLAGEELPPIDKASNIQIHHFDSTDNPERSALTIRWNMAGKVLLRADTRANDERLKIQYGKNIAFAEKLFEMLLNPNGGIVTDFYIRGDLPETDLPEWLKSFTNDVRVWREFLKPMRERNAFNFRYGSGVDSDRYFRLVTSGQYLKVNRKYADEYADDMMFDFPQAPKITDEHVFWDIPEKKVRIVLPHTSTDMEVVKHYGYEDVYAQYLKREADVVKEGRNQIGINNKAVEEARKIEMEKLRKSLLV